MTKAKKHSIYFLGIGGIGMSALARWFNSQGVAVHGYDAHPTPLTRQLEAEGMHVHYHEDVSLIPEKVERVVYTPAIPVSNAEFQYFVKKGIKMEKRAAVIGEISRGLTTIAVAGTHGKTSVTAMVAHILHEAGLPILAFIGGIAKNFGTNFVLSQNPGFMVVEADEYDRSFLTLYPDIAVVTSLDADHLDIYDGLKDLQNTFVQFVQRLPEKGKLIHHVKLNIFEKIPVRRLTYGNSKEAKLRAARIRIEDGRFCFDVMLNGDFVTDIRMLVPGEHYVENALAAIGAAREVGVEIPVIKKALEKFSGVQRRFDYRVRTPEKIFIDDYAHHPEELRATLQAIRKLYPQKKLTVVFQPHLYSRTRDFADDFARVLGQADNLILLDIYPAREKPIPGVTSQLIAGKISKTPVRVMGKKELLGEIKKQQPELLLTVGAGDIGLLVEEIEKILKSK